MTLPSITRGQGWRDDMILAGNWTLDSGVGLTTDGDNATITGTTVSNGANQTVPGSLSTDTYPFLLVRAKGPSTFQISIVYTSGSDNPTFQFTGSDYQVFTSTLTGGKTVSSIKIFHQIGSLAVDFVYFFKETLILPSVTRPIRMRKRRYLNRLQILQREGDIVQDLGSSSPEFDVSGSFITVNPNTSGNYAADVWPKALDVLVLESSTVQADGNPTWQWFNSDLYKRKVLVMDAMVEDVPGRQRGTMNDYTLRLLEWNTIGQDTGSLGTLGSVG